ncbi:DNA polymerase IV [Tsukamurella sp. 8F]|uniref:DNA polymerase IV n=1 Tax=unclassified Tsukamurella TaxID=2633480 RepID=UPI0023B9D17A|nr:MULTISPECIES: DNA polymerase IV [unclassified Tsukamurella]MDF0529637.1 DNA polymerase IV [Tsukamurella sp. 8J]MDF0585922.1 DNA polymerase IV [Tsukamurella sp. 8F]
MQTERGERAEASVLHADLDSFYASVEQRDDRRLRGRPVLVGGGVVVAASYEAKAFGVRCPTSVRSAQALCPHAVVVQPRFDAYVEASRRVFEIFRDTTPLVEGISVDEAFLDVGGLLRLRGAPIEIAADLKRRVKTEVGLPITVGVARSKFLAKIASAVGKPDGLLEVPPGGETAFLHPLPVRRLWGVGAVTEARLLEAGIRTVGELAEARPAHLSSLLGGASARHLYALAWAQDPRRVETGRRRRSIGSQRALGRGPHSPSELEATLTAIVDRLGKRLRKAERRTRTMVLRLRFGDYGRATRSRSVGTPTDRTDVILCVAQELLAEAASLIGERGCTLIGLSLTNLDDTESAQLELPFEADRGAELDSRLDELRSRFGVESVTRAALLGRRHGDDAPLLPD